ncbi:small VCP/p97-interacting protein [Neodiprion virginianus]|uniref:small VCP/p97-interacting protein n=1 Tax=Neodiprion fabricii TaxID=2872261 RepID=UPI001ED94934|nr:small VCP/p97-interacting protein [Neodiprion fabricii]XP_046627255.1 small VCP/p97-interacting protein [Neodiprion virginianus]
MGICTSCCKQSSSYEDLTPDPEVRRRQQVEAAEKRIVEHESRGIGNVDAVKRQQQRAAEVAKRQAEAGSVDQQTGLKWQVN